MSQVMKISKGGYNAITETDPNNLIFSSEYGTLKYHTSGTVQLVASGSDTETSVAHNLGYVPFFLVYYNTPTDSSKFSMTPFVFEDVFFYGYICAYADSSNIYFTIHTNSISATITFYYKIFRNDTGL